MKETRGNENGTELSIIFRHSLSFHSFDAPIRWRMIVWEEERQDIIMKGKKRGEGVVHPLLPRSVVCELNRRQGRGSSLLGVYKYFNVKLNTRTEIQRLSFCVVTLAASAPAVCLHKYQVST